MKKIPLRTCVITKEKLEKKDLLRVVRNKDGEVTFDITGKQNGKGAYLKKDLSVIEKAQKNHVLDKILKVQVPDEVYELLKKEIEK
jgi:predicted RNA-binding protein YlxR (DUF448 family)